MFSNVYTVQNWKEDIKVSALDESALICPLLCIVQTNSYGRYTGRCIFTLASQWGWHFCFLVKCLNSSWMDCYKICYRCMLVWQSPKALSQHRWGVLLMDTSAGQMAQRFPPVKSPVPLTTRPPYAFALLMTDDIFMATFRAQNAWDASGMICLCYVHLALNSKCHHLHESAGDLSSHQIIHSVWISCQHFSRCNVLQQNPP